MKLQKSTELALYSVLEFAGAPERHISATEIADKYGVSPHHLAKVLAQLTRAGIVDSVRGAGGGYRFAGNVRRLTLLDVIELFEAVDTADVAHHVRPEASTPVERALGAVLAEIDANARATFSSITQATMLRQIERQQTALSTASAATGTAPQP